jgi:hypothetical protein
MSKHSRPVVGIEIRIIIPAPADDSAVGAGKIEANNRLVGLQQKRSTWARTAQLA